MGISSRLDIPIELLTDLARTGFGSFLDVNASWMMGSFRVFLLGQAATVVDQNKKKFEVPLAQNVESSEGAKRRVR